MSYCSYFPKKINPLIFLQNIIYSNREEMEKIYKRPENFGKKIKI